MLKKNEHVEEDEKEELFIPPPRKLTRILKEIN